MSTPSAALRAAILILAALALGCASAGAATWRLQTAPRASESAEKLLAVSCTSSSACTAAGEASVSGRTIPIGEGEVEVPVSSEPLLETWNGTTWSVAEAPAPGDATLSTLDDVSCTGEGACVAVGGRLVPRAVIGRSVIGSRFPLVERWDGRSWTLDEVPLPAEARSGYLLGVSCVSASSCVAVGYLTNPGTKVLVAHWDGTSWSYEVPGAANFLNDVSCTSSSACVAVGHITNSALAMAWNGSAWGTHEVPVPREAGDTFLSGVSCVSSTSCVAVGEWRDATGSHALSDTWNGSAWTLQSVPSPPGAATDPLFDVSCSSASACTAVGDSREEAAAPTLPLALGWDGSRWALQEAVATRGSTSDILYGVSCTALTACTATGVARPSGANRSLIERYS